MTDKILAKLLLFLGIIVSYATFLGSATSYALGSNSKLAYTADKSINEQYDNIRELWHGNQNKRPWYVSSTNSIRPINQGWHTLYGKKYYVNEDNQWLVNTIKEIDGKTWYFDANGTVFEMWYDF